MNETKHLELVPFSLLNNVILGDPNVVTQLNFWLLRSIVPILISMSLKKPQTRRFPDGCHENVSLATFRPYSPRSR